MCWLPAQSSDLHGPRFSEIEKRGLFLLPGRGEKDLTILFYKYRIQLNTTNVEWEATR